MLLDNRKVHFAVGLTAIFIALRWLLTGDLLMAVEAVRPPAEGETKSIALLGVLWPMLIEACVIVGASLIGWSLKLWHWLADTIDNVGDKANASRVARPEVADVRTLATEPAAAIETSQASSPTGSLLPLILPGREDLQAVSAVPIDPQKLVAALAQAVAVGDTAAETQYRKEIRKPYLRVELSESISTANFARAREIITELEAMGQPVADVRKPSAADVSAAKPVRRSRLAKGGSSE